MRNSVLILFPILLASAMRNTLNAPSSSEKKDFTVGVWLGMYSDYWPSERTEWLRKVDEAFNSLKEAGIDAIFFLVKDPLGYVYYESKHAPLSGKYS